MCIRDSVEVYVKVRTRFMTGLFKVVSMLPVVSPPFVLSLSMIMLFGKAGIITRHLLHIYDNSVYGFWGIVIVQTMTFFPVCYMMFKGLLKNIDPSLEEAARDMGAGRGKVFLTVTLPLLLPGLGNAFLVTFIESIADFANPMIIGGSYDLRTFICSVAGNIDGRCAYCYRMRMEETARYARDNGFTHFTTTLLVSPYQNHEGIRQKGLELAERMLTTMEQLPRWNGHFYNWYHTCTLRPMPPLYVSTVDSGNCAAALLTAANALRGWGRDELAARAQQLCDGMDFGPLYDPQRRLMHIGIDTVKLGGKHFTYLVNEGDKVKKGQPLIRFELEAIKAEGYPVTTPVIVCNTDDYAAVEAKAGGTVKQGDALLELKR